MDKLPEKLIDKIVAYLEPHPRDLLDIAQLGDLADITRVSRLLKRICIPRLYKSVPLTVCKVVQTLMVPLGSVDEPDAVFDTITTKGCNAQKLLECLQRRPDLADHVKHLMILRNDVGFIYRLMLGWYGYAKENPAAANLHWWEVEKAARTKRPLNASRLQRTDPIKPSACFDEGFGTVRALLRVMPNLEQFDGTSCRTDTMWPATVEAFKALRWHPMPQNIFKDLKRVSLHCSNGGLARYWPVFILPNIRTIHLEAVMLYETSDADLIDGLQSLHSSSVEELELHSFRIVNWGLVNENAVYMLLKACRQLRLLSIQSNSPVSLVSGLTLSEDDHFAVPNDAEIGHQGDLSAFREPEDALIPVFRARKDLESLTIDVTDLLEIVKLMEKTDKHTGILSPHTFVMASVGEILVNVDLALPKSLRSLKLRASNGEKQRAATIRALCALIVDLSAHSPHLKRLETSWQQPFTNPPKGKNVGDDLVGIMEHTGLEYVETYFPDAAALQGHSAPEPEDW